MEEQKKQALRAAALALLTRRRQQKNSTNSPSKMFQDNSCCSIINQNTPIQTDRQLAANAHPVQRCEANEIHQEKEISLPYPWPDAAGEGNENIVLPSTASADSQAGFCDTFKIQAISLLYEQKRRSKQTKRKRTDGSRNSVAYSYAHGAVHCVLQTGAAEEDRAAAARKSFAASSHGCCQGSAAFEEEKEEKYFNVEAPRLPNSLPLSVTETSLDFPEFCVGRSARRSSCGLKEIMKGLWMLRTDPSCPLAAQALNEFIAESLQLCRAPLINTSEKGEEKSLLPAAIKQQLTEIFQLLPSCPDFIKIVEREWEKLATSFLQEISPWREYSNVSRWFARPAMMELLLCLVDDSSDCLSCLKKAICISAISTSLLGADLTGEMQDNAVALFCVLNKVLVSVHPKCYSQSCAATNWDTTLNELVLQITQHPHASSIVKAVGIEANTQAEALERAATDKTLSCAAVASAAPLSLQPQGLTLQLPLSLKLLLQTLNPKP